MAFNTQTNKVIHEGNGSTTSFSVPFLFGTDSDLRVILRDVAGEETVLTLTTHYSVTGAGESGGGLPTMLTAPADGEKLAVIDDPAITQEVSFADYAKTPKAVLEGAFDKSMRVSRKLQEQLNRCVKVTASSLEDPPSAEQMQADMDDTLIARDAAQAAQTAAETAQTGAQAAQVAAETARDEAQAIALDSLDSVRCDTPVLSGPDPAESAEGLEIKLLITDHVEDGITSYSLDTLGFGTARIGNDTPEGLELFWQLGTLEADATHSIEVVRRRDSEIYSKTATYSLLVTNVNLVDGAAVVFPDTVETWGVAPDADGIQPPAYATGPDNAKQIRTARMSLVQASGALTLDPSTTSNTLVTSESIAEGDKLITDQGEVTAGAVTDNSSASVLTNFADTVGGSATCGNSSNPDIAVQFVAQATVVDSIAVQADSLNGAVSFKGAIYSDDGADNPDSQIGSEGVAVDIDTAGVKVVIPVSASGLTIGEKYWAVLKAQNPASNYVNLEMVSNTESNILIAERGVFPTLGINVNMLRVEISGAVSSFTTDISSAGFASAPAAGYKIDDVEMALAAGAAGASFVPGNYNLAPAGYTATIDGGNLKITADMITLADDPTLVKLGMAVLGPVSTRFKSAMIEIQEVA